VTDAEKTAIGRRFHAALAGRDWSTLGAMLAADVTWTLPGDNRVSGAFAGPAQVVANFHKIAGFGVNFALQHVLVSRDNFALALHNTAQRGAIVLDEHVAVVCRLDGATICAIETYLSDVDGMNAFFV
jgi:hypothetical protein